MTVVRMTSDDVEDVVHLHLRSFDGYMNTRLGGYLRRFYAWFTNRPDAIALKCVIDGRLAGFVVGAPNWLRSGDESRSGGHGAVVCNVPSMGVVPIPVLIDAPGRASC